jgi:ribosomal protein S18 acetylase RimI-like enzyme
VRPARGLLELRQAARLRAEAYHADDRSRFAESFKRQFASQEADSLQHRTAPRGGRAPQCDCLVAVEAGGGGAVVGCIDIRVPQAATGLPASGVPPGEPGGAYILNVVVDEPARGRGVGRRLMAAAMARAVRVWGAARLFTHVEADNDVALALYRGCGFREHSGSAAYAGTSSLGEVAGAGGAGGGGRGCSLAPEGGQRGARRGGRVEHAPPLFLPAAGWLLLLVAEAADVDTSVPCGDAPDGGSAANAA